MLVDGFNTWLSLIKSYERVTYISAKKKIQYMYKCKVTTKMILIIIIIHNTKLILLAGICNQMSIFFNYNHSLVLCVCFNHICMYVYTKHINENDIKRFQFFAVPVCLTMMIFNFISVLLGIILSLFLFFFRR